jgi:hypothetical protein
MKAKSLAAYLASILAVAMLTTALTAADGVTVIPIPEDQNTLEFVGQFNNTPTTSLQFGYFSKILGLDSIFAGEPEDETTCLLTFVTNATTDRTILNGAFKIINRTGTTTVYLNTPPSDFSDPASFSQGTPVQVSTYTQQVVLNTTTNSFVTVHMNTITSTEPFSLNGKAYRIGRVGNSFRTTYSGQVNTSGAPSGWFGGNAVGVKKIGREL